LADIFAAFISEITHCLEPEHHNFLIEGVEFTHGGNVYERAPEQIDIAFKRTLGGYEFTQIMS
jgi:hypothetical protein